MITMLPIVAAPHSALSTHAQPVKKIDKGVLKLIAEMKKTLASVHDIIGVGLAAPQVGRSLQLFLMKPTPSSKIKVVINPVIVAQNQAESYPEISVNQPTNPRKSVRKRKTLEGCLSLKNIWGQVSRKPVITVSYMDEHGKTHTETFKGFEATIVQHEIDHLQGILFPKHTLEQKGKLYKSHKNEKGQDVFDEIEI